MDACDSGVRCCKVIIATILDDVHIVSSQQFALLLIYRIFATALLVRIVYKNDFHLVDFRQMCRGGMVQLGEIQSDTIAHITYPGSATDIPEQFL